MRRHMGIFFAAAVALSSAQAAVFTQLPRLAEQGTVSAWGDYDLDGDLDVVTGYWATSWASIDVLKNDGGTFTRVWRATPPQSTDGFAWGDYDNDRDLDFAVCGINGVAVYRNEGGDRFGLAWSSSNADPTIAALWGDCDGDGDLDLVQTSSGLGPHRCFLNDGGTFRVRWESGGTEFASKAALADSDGDGDLDLFVSRLGDAATVLTNDGTGRFGLAWTAPESTRCCDVACGDYTGDGLVDMVVAPEGGVNWVYRNAGGNAFVPYVVTNRTAYTIALGDHDGDGDLDILAGEWGGYLRVYDNTGGPRLSQSWTSEEVMDTASVSWADFDGDGDLDILAGTRMFRNDRASRIEPGWTGGAAADIQSVIAGDLDGDGDVDAALGGGGAVTNRVLANDGNGNFTTAFRFSPAEATYGLALLDFDNDGDLDIFEGNDWNTNRLWRNDGAWSFAHVWSSDIPVSAPKPACADFDGDGYLDLVLFSRQSISLLRNVAGASFVTAWTSTAQTRGGCIGDYDGDGDPDLLVAMDGAPPRVFRNDGNDLFTPGWRPTGSGSAADACFGDFDGDGDLDILAGFSESIVLFDNLGGDTFRKTWASIEGYGMSFRLRCADFDGDQDLDFYAAVEGGASALYANDGTGSFARVWLASVTATTRDAVVADLDGDGDPDVVEVSGNRPVQAYRNVSRCSFTDRLPNDPPRIARIESLGVVPPGSGLRQFRATIRDDESDAAVVLGLSYSIGGSAWTPAQTGGLAPALATSPAGIDHTFEWDTSVASKELVAGSDVTFRILLGSHFGSDGAGRSAGPLLYGASVYQWSGQVLVNAFPQCAIASPISTSVPYELVSGDVQIYGYAYDDDLDSYSLYYGAGETPGAWVTIVSNASSVLPVGSLGLWNTSALPAGTYALRVVARDRTGRTRDTWVDPATRTRVQIASVDEQASVVEASFPSDGQIDVAHNAPVVVRFSGQINMNTLDSSSIRLNDGERILSGFLDGSVVYNAYSGCLIFQPGERLLPWRDYVVTIGADIQDELGVPLGRQHTFRFRTSPSFPESVLSVLPGNTQPDAAADADVSIRYADASAGSFVYMDGIEVKPIGGPPVPYAFDTYDAKALTALYTNAAPLPGNTLYTVTANERSTGLGAYTWYFVTGDFLVPAILSNSHGAGVARSLHDSIRILFNKSMNGNSITTNTFTLVETANTNVRIPGVRNYYTRDNRLEFVPASPLAQDAVYRGTLTTGVRDFGGQPLATNYVFTFRTPPPISAPQSLFPAPDAANVSGGVVVHAQFAVDMEPDSATAANFRLVEEGGADVSATVSYEAGSKRIMLRPSSRLRVATTYTARLSQDVLAASGVGLARDIVWSFRTTPRETDPVSIALRPNLEDLVIGPNPVTRSDEDRARVVFGNLTAEWEIRICTLTGKLVATFSQEDDPTPGDGRFDWSPIRDERSFPLAPGGYIVTVSGAETEKVSTLYVRR